MGACLAYLETLRWPDGFTCPYCNAKDEPWRQSRGRMVCPVCRHQGTATAGTILDKMRTPLITWFEAAWHLTTAKNGISAKTLERTLGVRYRVAWTMLQRFRIVLLRQMGRLVQHGGLHPPRGGKFRLWAAWLIMTSCSAR